VGLSAAGVSTTYLVDTANPTGYPQVVEELVNGVVQRVYTYGITRISQSQVISGAWAASFYGYDGQGSVRFLSGSTGAVTDHYTYDAFGNQLVAVGATPNVNRYVGEPLDAALQMTYLRARYMNPGSGRFWTADSAQGNPYDPASLHRYLYAGGDPVNQFDPLGLFSMSEGSIVHQWISLNFLADGFVKGMYERRYGTGKGATSLGRILNRLSPGLVFPGSRKFPDLVDMGDHFMLEIKTTNERAEGAAQLADYLRDANRYDPFGTKWRPGTPGDFTPFPVVFCDAGATCLAFVHPPDASGVITYDELDLKPALFTLAVMGAAAGILAIEMYAFTAPFVIALLEFVATTASAVLLWASQAAAEIALGDAAFAGAH
jgi:RHS repeat-associated protein